ncbi:MAG: hypothetical protein WCD44_01050 [Candidatus Babeliales bacterium]
MRRINNIIVIIMLLANMVGAQEKEEAEKKEEATIEESKSNEAAEKEKEAEEEVVVEKEETATQEGKSEEEVEKEKEAEKEVVVEKEETAAQESKSKEVTEKETKEPVIEAGEETKPTLIEIMPEKSVDKSAELTEEIEETGIDTIDIDEPQGNWLFKRMWWEHAEERYEKIRDLVQKIWESRMSFFIKRNELDKMILDPFYISIGLGQGELQEILSELVDRIEKERQEEGVLNQAERLLLDQLQAEKQTLEQTKSDVELINQLNQEVDQALNRLMEQINRVRAYEQESWEYFKDIARVLNDKKARELFFKIDTALQNVKSVDIYLQQDFSQHFNQLLQKINVQINKVVDTMQKLKEKGIDFKKQINVTEEELPSQEKMEEEEEEEAKSWGKRVWDNIVAVIRWPYDKLFGSQAADTSD